MITWIYGQSGSGKTTLAQRMIRPGEILLDGDAMRLVWPGLGLDYISRLEQNLRIARLAKAIEEQGFNVIVATICPYKKLRQQVQGITNCKFIRVYGGETGVEYPFEE